MLSLPEGKEITISVLEILCREEMLWISKEAVSMENFPPCIRNMISKAKEEKGSHRSAAILAAFLGQAGWSELEARKLWEGTAGVEERIFKEWFGMMHCPSCETLKRESKGYPDLGIGSLGLCQPDERCLEYEGPVEYATGVKTESDRCVGGRKHIRTLYHARVFDWIAGREGRIDLSPAEKVELERLAKEQAEQKEKILIYTRARVKGRLRPRFFLRERDGPIKRVLSELL